MDCNTTATPRGPSVGPTVPHGRAEKHTHIAMGCEYKRYQFERWYLPLKCRLEVPGLSTPWPQGVGE